MKDILKHIEQADEIQLNELIGAVMRRYNVLHTERQSAFLSLSTDPYMRNAELENIIRFIHFCYNQQDSR